MEQNKGYIFFSISSITKVKIVLCIAFNEQTKHRLNTQEVIHTY